MESVSLPPALAALVEGATWEQVTLGESGAQVYRLRNGAETRYLKVEPRRPAPSIGTRPNGRCRC